MHQTKPCDTPRCCRRSNHHHLTQKLQPQQSQLIPQLSFTGFLQDLSLKSRTDLRFTPFLKKKVLTPSISLYFNYLSPLPCLGRLLFTTGVTGRLTPYQKGLLRFKFIHQKEKFLPSPSPQGHFKHTFVEEEPQPRSDVRSLRAEEPKTASKHSFFWGVEIY